MQTKEPKHINQGLGKTVQDQEPITYRLLAGHYMSLYTAYLPFDLQRELYRIIHMRSVCSETVPSSTSFWFSSDVLNQKLSLNF